MDGHHIIEPIAPRKTCKIITRMVIRIEIIPITIPAIAIPLPPKFIGSSVAFFLAMNPVTMAAIPATIPQHVTPRIPQTKDTTASVLFDPSVPPGGSGFAFPMFEAGQPATGALDEPQPLSLVFPVESDGVPKVTPDGITIVGGSCDEESDPADPTEPEKIVPEKS